MPMNANLRNTALYLAVIQFFFSLTWIVYVVYLGDLLEDVGIGRDKLLWFILLDQFVFIITDTLMGYNADRVERMIGRLGPMIVGINAVSCLAFALLPLVAIAGASLWTQTLWVVLLVLWIATSSVLRAPPIVLLMKHAAKPQVPQLAALVLAGLALAGALSPYLGAWLKQMSPLVPFVLTGATLFLTTMGLVWMERLPKPIKQAGEPIKPIPKHYFNPMLWALLGASFFLGLGFQVHSFLNSKAHYLQFAQPDQLIWLLPLFWVGFHLLVHLGAAFARRFGTLDVMLLVLPIGILGLSLVASSINLNSLMTAQIMAGGVWGILFMAGISASLYLGRGGSEGKVLGLWFSMLALSAVIRVILVLSGFAKDADVQAMVDWLPAFSWVIASILLYIAWYYHHCYQREQQ